MISMTSQGRAFGIASPVLQWMGLDPSPSIHDRIRAGMHLFAVLPRLTDVVRHDEEGRRIADKMRVSIEFRVLNGPRVVLSFADGRIKTRSEGKSDLGLLFTSCAQLNNMFDGRKVLPIPFKGLHKAGELSRLTRLTEILTRYLKPSDTDMQSPRFRESHVEMSLLVGLSATQQIALQDPRAERIANHLPNGTIQYIILDGPACHVVLEDGLIEARSGTIADPTTTIEIQDIDLAVSLIKGEVDTFAANGSGAIKASGSLVLADEFNTLFDRVGHYLQ